MSLNSASPNAPVAAFRWPRFLSTAQDLAVVLLFGIFLVAHASNVANGHLTSIPFVVEHSVLIAIFLTRRRSVATTTRPFDWFVAAVGGWLTLALQIHPSSPGWVEALGFTLQLSGLTLVSVCFLGLGRSFGIVAANRGLKTKGPYQIVRHPIYACHLITMIGFILVNPHWINFVIAAVVITAQVLRMRAEERVLTESGDYATYAAEVRYRLVPGVY